MKSTPLMRKIITITGDAVNTPCNFNVKLGTNYQELIEAAGGFKEEPEKIISGGPMMGQALFTVDIPVSKTSSALTFSKRSQSFLKAACIIITGTMRLGHTLTQRPQRMQAVGCRRL